MATNLDLDDNLIEEVRQLGGHRTKKAAVTAALEAYLRHHKQLKVLDLFGQVEFDSDYDYKAERQRA